MYDLVVRFLSSAFVDAGSIAPDPADITQLSNIVGQYGLLPFTAQELTSEGVKQRLGFRKWDGTLEVVLLGSRFNVVQTGQEQDFEEFCRMSAAILIPLLDHYQRKPHRLAAVQEGLLPHMSEEELHEIPDRILHLPPVFKSHAPFEWNWRSATRVEREFGGGKELTNTIATIMRTTAEEPGGRKLDRVKLDLDINTVPEKVTARFGKAEIEGFFSASIDWHAELGAEMLQFIRGE